MSKWFVIVAFAVKYYIIQCFKHTWHVVCSRKMKIPWLITDLKVWKATVLRIEFPHSFIKVHYLSRLYQQQWPLHRFVPGKTLTPRTRLSPSLLPRTRTSGSSSTLKPPRAWTWVRLRTSSPLVGRVYCLYALHGGCMHPFLTENINILADAWLLHQRHVPQSHVHLHTCCTEQLHMQVANPLCLLRGHPDTVWCVLRWSQ